MRKLYLIFGTIVIIKQIFTFKMPIFSASIGGYNLDVLLFFSFIGISLFIFVFDCLMSRKVRPRDIGLLLYVLFSALGTIVNWTNTNAFLTDASLFLMPIAVYVWVQKTNIKPATYVKILAVASVGAAIVSILVSIGVMDVGIWAADGDLVRVAGVVNSTFGVCGMIVASVLIFNSNKTEHGVNLLLLYVTLICGFIIVFLSFSRTRWVLCAGIFFLIFLSSFGKKAKQNNFGALRIICFVIIALFVMAFFAPEFFGKLFEQMLERFDNISSGDDSILYRGEEAGRQFDLFLTNPVFGVGWGKLTSNDIYVHAVYPGLLAQSGLFALCYLAWYFSPLLFVLQYRKIRGNSAYVQTSLLLQFSLFILNFTNAGFVVSGGYFMLAGVFIIEQSLLREKG